MTLRHGIHFRQLYNVVEYKDLIVTVQRAN